MMENNLKLPIKVKIYDDFLLRFKGLMFRKTPLKKDEGILLTPCNSIHMFFMFFSIDVIFINKNNEIVEIIESIRPWKFVLPIKNAHSALEVYNGFIREHNIKKGMKIIF